MKRLRLLLCAVVLLAITGCDSAGNAPNSPTPIPPQTVATVTLPIPTQALPGGSTDTPPGDVDPTASLESPPPPSTTSTAGGQIEVPTPTVPAGEAITATLVAELQGTAIAGVQPTSTPDSNGMSPFAGIDGISVLPLSAVPATGEYWLAYSTGSRRLDNEVQQHFVLAFQRASDGWKEVSRIALQNPDYMSDGSVMQVNLEPSHTWLSVDSGVGAHGGCFDLLSFDGKALRNETTNCASSPGAGSIEDLDGDGKGEVLLNATDNYVFCYACGVRRISFSVLRWDGSGLVPVQVTDLPTDAPAEVKADNDRSVELFKHELMKDALVEIDKAYALDPSTSIVKWNHSLIKLHAEAREEHVRESNYPLLTNAFYGDYAAAVDVLRGYTLDQVMLRGEQSPLVIGTPAEGSAELLTSYITGTATLALEAEPDLAPAYYLRGWAYHLSGTHDAEALSDFDRAATLDPKDSLFVETLNRLKQ